MAEQYKGLGFEVLLEPIDTASEECTTCLKDPAFSQLYKTIYTAEDKKVIAKGLINPVVALNSALGFIIPLTIEAQPLNQHNPLDHPNGTLKSIIKVVEAAL